MIQGPRYVYFFKIIWFLPAALFLIASLAIDGYDNAPQLNPQVHKKMQATLLQKISALENQVNGFAKAKKKDNIKPFKPKPDCFLHIYKNNELVYWNTNQLPISATINPNEIKNGVFKLSNGYYYIFSKKINNIVFQGSFLIQSEYEIENEYLTNTFNSSIYDGKAHLAITKKSTYSIKDKYKNHLFYITSKSSPNTFASNSTLTFVLLFGSKYFDMHYVIQNKYRTGNCKFQHEIKIFKTNYKLFHKKKISTFETLSLNRDKNGCYTLV